MKNLRHFSRLKTQTASKWLFAVIFLLSFTNNSISQCVIHGEEEEHKHETPTLTAEQIAAIKKQLSVQSFDGAESEDPEPEEEICHVNINIHFILDDDGQKNFRKHDDGHGNTNYTGYDRAEQLVNYANFLLANNQPMNLPVGNSTPTPDINWRLVLNGVYFHEDSQYRYDYVWDFHPNWGMHNDYEVNANNTINIFFTQSDTTVDSNGFPRLQGTANGLCATRSKSGNGWRYYTKVVYDNGMPNNSQHYTEEARNMLHEIGHNWDLRHAWGADLCNDTPTHNNAYCSNLPAQKSNNLMDYNCRKPAALSPCQVSKVDNCLLGDLNDYIHQCGCAPTTAFFDLPNTMSTSMLPLSATFRGKGSWAETNYKLEIFSVSQIGSTTPANPSDVYTSLKNGTVGTLNLANFYNFVANKTYLVRLTTYNDCDNDVMVKYIKALPASTPGPGSGSGGGNRIAPSNGNHPSINGEIGESKNSYSSLDVAISPNPAKDRIQLSYQSLDLGVTTNIQLSIIGINGQIIYNEEYNSISELPLELSLAGIDSGIYSVVFKTSSGTTTKKLVIIK